MDINFNWKNYLIFAGLFSVTISIFKWKIGVGFIIGTIAYFLNDKLLSKRFPSLNSSSKAIGSVIIYILLQGLIIFATAVVCWFIGRFESFFAAFGALTLPTMYFIVSGIFKK